MKKDLDYWKKVSKDEKEWINSFIGLVNKEVIPTVDEVEEIDTKVNVGFRIKLICVCGRVKNQYIYIPKDNIVFYKSEKHGWYLSKEEDKHIIYLTMGEKFEVISNIEDIVSQLNKHNVTFIKVKDTHGNTIYINEKYILYYI